jgi:hypothetical protein
MAKAKSKPKRTTRKLKRGHKVAAKKSSHVRKPSFPKDESYRGEIHFDIPPPAYGKDDDPT